MNEALSVFGRDVQRMSRRVRARLLRHALEYWRGRGFPYLRLTRNEIHSEFQRLRAIEHSQVLVGGEARSQTVGLRLANYFHPQMWSIRRNGRSAVEIFRNDESLLVVLEKCPEFYPDRRCWDAPYVRGLLRLHHGVRVGNFRPAVARAIYQRYSRDGDTILDFSAGFGGRMLGALTLNRHYIGVDPSNAQMRGLLSMRERLLGMAHGSASLHHACAEDCLPELASSSVNLIFTSPPYFDNERYSPAVTQSCNRFPSYDLWRSQFLFKMISESHRILRAGGFLLLNISNLPHAPLADDAQSMSLGLFRRRSPLRLLMRCLPNSSTRRQLYRTEPILVLQKCRRARCGKSMSVRRARVDWN